MTEHGASVFVFFFLGEYSSLILMSSFMSIFFLGGHHCPDLHRIIIDPFIHLYYFLERDLSPFLIELYENVVNYNSNIITSNKNSNILVIPEGIQNNYMTQFSSRDTMFEFINILIDRIQGAYILGFKIIIVVFFYI